MQFINEIDQPTSCRTPKLVGIDAAWITENHANVFLPLVFVCDILVDFQTAELNGLYSKKRKKSDRKKIFGEVTGIPVEPHLRSDPQNVWIINDSRLLTFFI